MKILLLEPDKELAENIKKYLCSTRQKFNIKIIHNEKDIFNDISFLFECSIFIFNLKDPTNTSVMRKIREYGNLSPILLILEKDVNPCIFKTIYYLSYEDVIAKEFKPEEIAFHVYKLCDIWNDDIFFLSKDAFFNYEKSIFCFQEEITHLGKKENALLKLLFIKNPCIVSHEEISHFVYEDEIVTEDCIRSLIRQVRTKIPIDIIDTVKGEGYKIINKTSIK